MSVDRDLLNAFGLIRQQILDEPGTWRTVATYSGGAHVKVARVRAAALALALRNPYIQIDLRTRGQSTHIVARRKT